MGQRNDKSSEYVITQPAVHKVQRKGIEQRTSQNHYEKRGSLSAVIGVGLEQKLINSRYHPDDLSHFDTVSNQRKEYGQKTRSLD
jgi:hypothetical protein